MIAAERYHVEGVAAAVELIEEVAVGALRCVVYLQLTARVPVFLSSFCVLDRHDLRALCFFILSFQNGPGGFVAAVTRTPGFGLLRYVTVDPTPQLMCQLHALGPVNRRLTRGRRS